MNPGKGLSRRHFVAGSTAVAGTALLGAVPAVHAQEDNTIRIALVGCGGRGRGAAANCLRVAENIRLVAVADVFDEKVQVALKSLRASTIGSQVDVPPERVFVGFDAYKKAMACDVDIVLLCTPPGFRPVQYRAAIDAGIHAFLEKPVCVDAAGFRLLMETNKLADEKGLKVCVGHQMHHEPATMEMVKRIHEGALGKIHLMEVIDLGGYHYRSKFPRKRPDQSEMDYQMRNWHGFTWLCGDVILEGGFIHYVDVANWIMNTHPVEANAIGGRERPRGPEHGQNFDHHFIQYTFADGVKFFAQTRDIPGCWNASCTIAHGTEAVGGRKMPRDYLTAHGRVPSPPRFSGIIGKDTWSYDGPRVNAHFNEHVMHLDAIINDKEFNEGYWGGETSMTVILGRMASYSGQLLTWDEAVAKGKSLVPEKLAWDMDPPVMPDEQGTYPMPMPGVYQPF